MVILSSVLLSNSGAYALYLKLRLVPLKSPVASFNFKIIFPPVLLPSGFSTVYKLESMIFLWSHIKPDCPNTLY